ncbi:MAG: TIGR03086 family metal-binding protein [Pseudonocardiaceae bacterium]
MREVQVFLLADRTLNDVIQQIKDDQWLMVMPADFAMRQTDQVPTLREIVNYHAYDDAWVPDMLAGRTMDQAGRDKFDGDLLGADPKAAFAAVVDTACAAVTQLDDPDRIVHCSFGDFSAREYFWQINGFRALRAHDLALVIGAQPRLSDELVQGVWDEISPHAEQWRSIGVFPPAVPVPQDAPLLDRLLGITGRPPTSV